MSEWPGRIQEFVNEIAASVAVVGHDAVGDFWYPLAMSFSSK